MSIFASKGQELDAMEVTTGQFSALPNVVMHLINGKGSSCWIQIGCNQYILGLFCKSEACMDNTRQLT